MEKKNSDGTNLAKVLWYYNFVPDLSTNQKIVCPFHEDVNPSLIVDLEVGKWFCFGCSKSGDAIGFVKEMETKYNNLNDLKSLQKYFKIIKSKKCSDIIIKACNKLPKSQNKTLYKIAWDYYHGLKKTNWKCLNEDELDQLTAKEYMIKRGFDENILNESGAKYTYNNNYLIIFPMYDNGKFKGWVCRTTVPEIEQKRKYLYNEGFSRANTLVGDYGKKSFVIIVEGYMDRLKFIQYGEKNVVAILGWKMSNQQIEKLKNAGITTIISALDNDPCGRKGTKYLQDKFNVIRFKYIKGIKDPGEMSKEIFSKCLNKTKELYKQYLLEERKKKNGIIG